MQEEFSRHISPRTLGTRALRKKMSLQSGWRETHGHAAVAVVTAAAAGTAEFMPLGHKSLFPHCFFPETRNRPKHCIWWMTNRSVARPIGTIEATEAMEAVKGSFGSIKNSLGLGGPRQRPRGRNLAPDRPRKRTEVDWARLSMAFTTLVVRSSLA